MDQGLAIQYLKVIYLKMYDIQVAADSVNQWNHIRVMSDITDIYFGQVQIGGGHVEEW